MSTPEIEIEDSDVGFSMFVWLKCGSSRYHLTDWKGTSVHDPGGIWVRRHCPLGAESRTYPDLKTALDAIRAENSDG